RRVLFRSSSATATPRRKRPPKRKKSWRKSRASRLRSPPSNSWRRSRPFETRSEERRVGKECRYWRDWSSDVCSSDLAKTTAEKEKIMEKVARVAPSLSSEQFLAPIKTV